MDKDKWSQTNDLLVGLGQTICFARNPRCSDCLLNKTCDVGIENMGKKSKGKGTKSRKSKSKSKSDVKSDDKSDDKIDDKELDVESSPPLKSKEDTKMLETDISGYKNKKSKSNSKNSKRKNRDISKESKNHLK